jgi:hypothetical protein
VSRAGSNNTCRSSPITAQRNHAGYIGRPSPRMRTRRVQQPAPSAVCHTTCYAAVYLSTLLSCRPKPPPPLRHQPGDTTRNGRSRPGWRDTLGVYAFSSSRVLGWVCAYGKHGEAREGQPASGCAARIIEADRPARYYPPWTWRHFLPRLGDVCYLGSPSGSRRECSSLVSVVVQVPQV